MFCVCEWWQVWGHSEEKQRKVQVQGGGWREVAEGKGAREAGGFHYFYWIASLSPSWGVLSLTSLRFVYPLSLLHWTVIFEELGTWARLKFACQMFQVRHHHFSDFSPFVFARSTPPLSFGLHSTHTMIFTKWSNINPHWRLLVQILCSQRPILAFLYCNGHYPPRIPYEGRWTWSPIQKREEALVCTQGYVSVLLFRCAGTCGLTIDDRAVYSYMMMQMAWVFSKVD